MNIFKKVIAGATALGVAATMLFSFGGVASADCWQYSGDGFTTSTTPVFNNICGVPENIGNESDFVRLRQSSNGNDMDNVNNPAYNGTGVSSACNDGDKFDVYNYVHNDASQDFNNNGSGSAVAHNVQIAMHTGLGTTASSFNFASTVSASNAASVSDGAILTCNGGAVKLTLVPSTVHVYSPAYGWQSMADSSVNGTAKLGSDHLGSGNQWGCWNYRILVVYEVQVHKVTPPPTPPQVTAKCDMLGVVADQSRKVTVNKFSFTAKNATVKNIVLNWGDNSANTTLTNANAVVGQTHQYAKEGTFKISATVTFAVADKPDIVSNSAACAATVSFSSNKPPVVTPPTQTPPTTLVNTGAGSTLGLFAAVTAAGAVAYRYMLGRRLSRQ